MSSGRSLTPWSCLSPGDRARDPDRCAQVDAFRKKRSRALEEVRRQEKRLGTTEDDHPGLRSLRATYNALDQEGRALTQEIRDATNAEVHRLATVATEDHLVTESAMAAARTNREAARKEAEKMVAAANRHLRTFITGDALDAATRVCHDMEGRTINRMMDMTGTTAVDGGGTDEDGVAAAAVEGGGDAAAVEEDVDAAAVEEDGAAATVEGGGDTAEERTQRDVEADIVQTLAALIEEDAATAKKAVDAASMDDGEGLYEPAIEPKPKAKPRARAKAKATAEPPLGALICGRGSCAFWTLRQASMTTHRAKNCKGEVPVNFVDDKPSKNTRAAKRARTEKDKDDTAASSTPAAAVPAAAVPAAAVPAAAVPVAAVPAAAVPVAAVPVDTYVDTNESPHEMQTREDQQDEVLDRLMADRLMKWVRGELHRRDRP